MIHLAITSNIVNDTPEKHSLELVKIIHDTSQNIISPPLSRRFKLPSAFEWNFYKSPKVSHAQFKCNQLEATCRAYPSIPPKKKHHVRNLSKPSNVTTPSTAASPGSFRAAAALRWCVGVPKELAFLEKGFPVPVCRFLRAAAAQPSFPSEWWWSISRSLVSLIMFTFQPPLRPAGPPSPFHTYWGAVLGPRARGGYENQCTPVVACLFAARTQHVLTATGGEFARFLCCVYTLWCGEESTQHNSSKVS